MLMAVRFEGQEHEEPDWLHTHTPEYPLADIRRSVVMDNARVFGLLLCITVIGIPWGKQHFKMAGLSLAPFGKEVELGI